MSIAAAALLSYAALVSWLGPAVLVKITNRGINPRLGVAAWLTAIGGVLGAWLAAVIVLSLSALRALFGGPAWALCLEILGHVGHTDMARPVTATIAVGVVAMALTLSAVVGRRACRTLRASRTRSREHAAAARVVGSPTRWRDVVVVAAERPAAYCVGGRPRAIVVTTAALASLEDDQLAAVLAHERAHLAGRHHVVLMSLRAMASGLSRLPLFAIGPQVVARLLEMRADDAAARRHGSHPLLCGLMTLAAGPAGPTGVLGAADTAVLDRATRLAAPPARGARLRDGVALCTTIGLTVAAPLVAGLLCHH